MRGIVWVLAAVGVAAAQSGADGTEEELEQLPGTKDNDRIELFGPPETSPLSIPVDELFVGAPPTVTALSQNSTDAIILEAWEFLYASETARDPPHRLGVALERTPAALERVWEVMSLKPIYETFDIEHTNVSANADVQSFGPRGNYSAGPYNGMGEPARPTGNQSNATATGGCDSFVVMAADTNTCAGSAPLTTAQQCTDSQASFPPMTLPDTLAIEEDEPPWPTGCYLYDYMSVRKVYWNADATNTAQERASPICCAKWSAADSSSKKSKTGVIIGASVAGGLLVVVAVAGYIIYERWKQRQKFAGNFGYSRNLL